MISFARKFLFLSCWKLPQNVNKSFMLPAKTRFSLMKYVFSSHFNGFRFSLQHANLRYEKLSSACAIIFKFFAWWCYAKHRSVFFSQIIANNWCCTCANYKISRFAIVKWKERKQKRLNLFWEFPKTTIAKKKITSLKIVLQLPHWIKI